VILNSWQSFLTKLIPVFESMGSAVQTISYIVLFIILPALVYSCKTSINKCHAELKRQNHLMHSQTHTLNELNFWMQYFDEKMIKRENQAPETNGELKTSSPVDNILHTKDIAPKKAHDELKTSSPVENIQHTKDIAPKKRESFPVDKDNADFQSTSPSIYKKTI
jgi:hypothetical protein